MNVKLLDGESETVEWEGTLADFVEANEYTEEDAQGFRDELKAAGRVWLGGGAAPLMMLKTVGGVS